MIIYACVPNLPRKTLLINIYDTLHADKRLFTYCLVHALFCLGCFPFEEKICQVKFQKIFHGIIEIISLLTATQKKRFYEMFETERIHFLNIGRFKYRKFLTKLWCCVGGKYNKVSIRSDEGPTLETSAFKSLYGGQFTSSTQLIKPNYLHFFKDFFSILLLESP